jgi:hypothetical protein
LKFIIHLVSWVDVEILGLVTCGTSWTLFVLRAAVVRGPVITVIQSIYIVVPSDFNLLARLVLIRFDQFVWVHFHIDTDLFPIYWLKNLLVGVSTFEHDESLIEDATQGFGAIRLVEMVLVSIMYYFANITIL